MEVVVKYDYRIESNTWRYWMQIDEEGLVWYPVEEYGETDFPGMVERHNAARRKIKDKHAKGVYEGRDPSEMLVQPMSLKEMQHIVWIREQGVHLIDMRGK